MEMLDCNIFLAKFCLLNQVECMVVWFLTYFKGNNRPMKEAKIYGLSACLGFAEKRPGKIKRAYFSDKSAKKFSALMKAMSQKKKVYRLIPEEELSKLTKSMHHEGVCFVVEHDDIYTLKSWFQKKLDSDIILFLENIGNPHNLGAIMRVCSHFGVSAIAHPNPTVLQSGAAVRTAEGGFESLSLIECESPLELIKAASGYKIFSTSSHQGESIYKTTFSSKCIIMLGEEALGLSHDAFKSAKCVQIPGSGLVESLNVATAAAVILSEVWRQNKKGTV